MDDLDRIRRDVQKKLNLTTDAGVLGDETGRINVPYKPGYVYVRTYQASGFSAAKVVKLGPNVNLPMKPGIPVTLGFDYHQELCILTVDSNAMLTAGANPLSLNPFDPSMQFSRQADIVTALCTPDNPDTTLYVLARGWWFLYNRTWYRFGGERVNLTSFVPSAGQHRVVGIFVLADGSATEAKGSTAQSMLAPLDKSDVQEATDAATDGSTPLWFWTLYGGQTAIKASDTFIDGRNMLNVGLGLPLNPVRVVTAAGAVTVSATDSIVVVNKTVGAATTVNLPAGVTGRVYTIKDGAGDALLNNITLTPVAGTIDGASTYPMNLNYQAVTVVYNGTEWNVI